MKDLPFLQGLSDLGRRHGVGLTGQMQLYVLDRDDQQFDYTSDAEGFVRLGSSRDMNGAPDSIKALARVSVLAAIPGLKDRIVAAFGKAAWVDNSGISVHGSDDGGRLAMNHSGWAALPTLLDEALAPVGSLIAEWDANRASLRAAEAEITRLKEGMEARRRALGLAMQFVDLAAGEGLSFDADGDRPAMDAADVCFAVAEALGIEDLDSDAYRVLVACPVLATLEPKEHPHG